MLIIVNKLLEQRCAVSPTEHQTITSSLDSLQSSQGQRRLCRLCRRSYTPVLQQLTNGSSRSYGERNLLWMISKLLFALLAAALFRQLFHSQHFAVKHHKEHQRENGNLKRAAPGSSLGPAAAWRSRSADLLRGRWTSQTDQKTGVN